MEWLDQYDFAFSGPDYGGIVILVVMWKCKIIGGAVLCMNEKVAASS